MAFALVFLAVAIVVSGEPNPPVWPSNVYVFDPANSGTTQTTVDSIYSKMGGHNPPFNGQFSSDRYAFLFRPGSHSVTVNVGYYTTVIGLGAQPTDTHLTAVRCENGDYDYTGGALDNFWRSAENFAQSQNMLWAVSQASPLRRVSVTGNLDLYQYNSGCCAGYASGGWLSDSSISGTVTSGSQQQWITRNTKVGNWNGGVWNMVFVGNTGGIPGTHCGTPGPYTTIASAPVVAEKPYITVDSTGKNYTLKVPNWEQNKQGPTSNFGNVQDVDFSNVYVATPSDSAATINSKLAAGEHVILSPGYYKLTASIQINRSNTVLMGIGMATVVNPPSAPAVVIGNVDGVRLGGILFEAAQGTTPSLVQWGNTGYAGSASNPGLWFDAFARVGGTNDPSQYQVGANAIAVINSGNVVIDNSWFWRADHGISGNVVNGQNPNNHGLIVNGDDVTIYGLASEHQLQDLVQWNGNGGRVYFYQSELPYDVTQENFGTPGYVSYRVNSSVTTHNAYGAGVYSFFRDNAVTVQNAIVSPINSGVKFQNSLTVFLNGLGSIEHIINDQGNRVSGAGQTAYEC